MKGTLRMTLNIWPYEVKTSCDTCRDEFDPEQLWHLFEGEARKSGDVVCISCIPEDSWAAWEREGRATDAANIVAWLLNGSPECVSFANTTLAKIRERDELNAMRARLVARNLGSRTFDSPVVERHARESLAGQYRTWTRQQLEGALAELPQPL